MTTRAAIELLELSNNRKIAQSIRTELNALAKMLVRQETHRLERASLDRSLDGTIRSPKLVKSN